MAFWRLVPSLSLLLLGVHAGDWHGISPSMQQKLHAASNFLCDNGQQRLDLSRLNDNYCDCEDGSDEPGTSACSHTAAVFHCVNAGFFPVDVPTSHVNDGVCDCCDGSDEYASGASCASNCHERMQSFKIEKKDLIEQVKAGLKDRVALMTETQKLWDEEEQKKRQLETSTTSLRATVKQLETKKEQRDQLELEEKERHVAGSKQEILTQLGLLDMTKEQLASIILEIGREGVSAKHELLPIIRKEREAALGKEEELAKTPMDELDEAFRVRDDARQEETRRIEKLIEERQEEEEMKALKAEKDLEDDVTEEEEEAREEEASKKEEDLTLPEIEAHPIDRLYDALVTSERYESPQALLIRKQYEDAKQELKEAEEKLTEVQKLMSKDYGVDRIFFSLRGKCVESTAGQYTYKVCFFGKAMQDQTTLGNMEDINGPAEADGEESDDSSSISSKDRGTTGTIVKEITFSEGQKCWNGPKRSMTVKLECGPGPMELFDIEEPSTCLYSAKLRTPAVCSKDVLEQIATFNDGRVAPHHIEIEVSPTQ